MREEGQTGGRRGEGGERGAQKDNKIVDSSSNSSSNNNKSTADLVTNCVAR